jgi:uncharacterized protein YqgQ
MDYRTDTLNDCGIALDLALEDYKDGLMSYEEYKLLEQAILDKAAYLEVDLD